MMIKNSLKEEFFERFCDIKKDIIENSFLFELAIEDTFKKNNKIRKISDLKTSNVYTFVGYFITENSKNFKMILKGIYIGDNKICLQSGKIIYLLDIIPFRFPALTYGITKKKWAKPTIKKFVYEFCPIGFPSYRRKTFGNFSLKKAYVPKVIKQIIKLSDDCYFVIVVENENDFPFIIFTY